VPDQLSLDDTLAARIRARRSDPPPSHLAARAIVASGELGRQQGVALVLVTERPGLTAWELAEGDTVLRYCLSRRLPELVRKGLVARGEPRVCRVAGRAASTWWPVEG
jgi:hypothetical protein